MRPCNSMTSSLTLETAVGPKLSLRGGPPRRADAAISITLRDDNVNSGLHHDYVQSANEDKKTGIAVAIAEGSQ